MSLWGENNNPHFWFSEVKIPFLVEMTFFFKSLLNCIIDIHADVQNVWRTGKSESLQKLEFTGRHWAGEEGLCLSNTLKMQRAREWEEEEGE